MRTSSTGIGDEDVLDGPPPPPLVRRTTLYRRRDVAAAVLIAATALVAGLLVAQTSDLRATTAQPYLGRAERPAPPTVFPPSLGEAWRAPSAATPVPVAVGPTVVTADGGEVLGRDPITGDVRWRYARDLRLCTVSSAWSKVLTVFETTGGLLPEDSPRAAGGCSEVTALDPVSGQRGKQPDPDERRDKPDGGQRNTDAELGTRLVGDGTYVTTTGSRLLTTWRSDLVQTMQYGTVPAIVNPNKQPRTDCHYGSVAVTQGKVGVLERCESDSADRLTVYKATGEDNDAEKPVVASSIVVGAKDARIVAMSASRTAVVLPNPSRLVVFDEKGDQLADYPLDLPAADLHGDPPGKVVPTARTADNDEGLVLWFTGSQTIALAGKDLYPVWTVRDSLGPGVVFAGRVVLPVPDGIAVLDIATAQLIGTIPVDREGYSGPVLMATIGPMVLEQRGTTLVALR